MSSTGRVVLRSITPLTAAAVVVALLGALVAVSGSDEAAAITPTPSPTPTPSIPSTVATFVNDTGQVVNDLHVEVGLAGSVSLTANAPGCPVPSGTGGNLISSIDVVWSATCVDPGESVTLEIFADCFSPLCGPPGVSSHYWTLNGTPVGTPTPTPLPVGGIVELGVASGDSPVEQQSGPEREVAALTIALAAVAGVSWHRYRRRAR